ncbi:hypothetical protein I4U23_016300 [Adineta vaga]|nr:hypothetical protein I4U23_016300 [Adineta vaga]
MINTVDTGICGFLWPTCSHLAPCDSLNHACYQSNTICVRHPRCQDHPICYPISMMDQKVCPPMNALEPFQGQIQNLDKQIDDAKFNCHYPSQHNLTRDESAALYLYLLIGNNETVRSHLQNAWDSNDEEQMKPYGLNI